MKSAYKIAYRQMAAAQAAAKLQRHVLTGLRPTAIIHDEWQYLGKPKNAETDFVTKYAQAFAEHFKRLGITPPKSACSPRGWQRFMTYALKRGRSNHPHNAKWKPIMETYTAMRVTETLEPK